MFDTKAEEKAFRSFENIKNSIKGLYEILNINLAEDDFYYESGTENLTGLYKNLIELLVNDSGLRKLVKRMKNSELDLNIVLNEYLVE